MCDRARSGSLKCEACNRGCQNWTAIDFSLNITNERSHWVTPDRSFDVLVYRSEDFSLWASVRADPSNADQQAWPPLVRTNIPNDNSNLNSGLLPDGRVFLVHNPVSPASGDYDRDPITIATSVDGFDFNQVGVAMTCSDLSVDSVCGRR